MRLQRYIGKELILAFLLLLAIVTAIVGAALILQFLHKAPELGLVAMLQALPYVLPEAFPITLPLAFLVACLLAYGRFASDNEFTALKMGGVHPWHAVAPAILIGAVLSLATLWLSMDVLPWATLGKKAILKDQIQQLVSALGEGDATSVSVGKNFQMSAGGRNDSGEFVDVYITYRGDKSTSVSPASIDGQAIANTSLELRAERARLWLSEDGDTLFLRLFGAQWRQGDTRVTKREALIAVTLDSLVGESPHEEHKRAELMTVSQLHYRMERDTPDPQQKRDWQSELWRRLALGIAPLVFGAVGAPLGLVTGRGSRAAAFITALVVALPVYYPLLRLGENLAESGTLPAPLALNLGNLMLVGGGLYLLRKAVRT